MENPLPQGQRSIFFFHQCDVIFEYMITLIITIAIEHLLYIILEVHTDFKICLSYCIKNNRMLECMCEFVKTFLKYILYLCILKLVKKKFRFSFELSISSNPIRL